MVKVLQPGFYTSIQDLGRDNFQDYGVPFSGAMDKKAATLVNALLGNDANDAILEMTMTGAKLQFKIMTCIAISGADMSPKLNGLDVPLNRMIRISPKDVLSFGKLKQGFRSYLGVLGGFKEETVLGSKSMCQNITEGIRIQNNDELHIFNNSTNLNELYSHINYDVSYIKSNLIEAYKGPEYDYLTEAQKQRLFSEPLTISKDNSRMAYQLEDVLKNDLKPIITSAVLPGTVQLTPSGKLIILMRDCQTTGGYPRVLQLKESAIDVLAQKYTNKKISFKLI